MISTLYNNIQVATFVVGVVAALGISLLYKARLRREQTPLPVEPGEGQEQRAYGTRRAAGAGLVVLALIAFIALIVTGINLQQPISTIGVLIGLTAGLVVIWFIQTRSEGRSAAGKDETEAPGQ